MVCQIAAETSGVQVVVPTLRRNHANLVLGGGPPRRAGGRPGARGVFPPGGGTHANLVVAGVPPVAVAVQVISVPYMEVAGLGVTLTVRGDTTTICPMLQVEV